MTDIDLLDLTPTQGFKILGAEANYYTGWSVYGICDINGDGINDLVIGALGADENTGRVYVIYGSNSDLSDIDLANLSSEQGFEILGAELGDSVGISVTCLDINGDGKDDLVIGAIGVSSSTGMVYIIYGKTGNFNDINLASLTSELGFKISGVEAQDQVGWAVCKIDINGDGFDDLAIGAYAAPAGDSVGIVYVIYGKNGNFNNINLASLTQEQGFKILGASTEYQTGYSVSSGDINGDGVKDLIIGARTADPNSRDGAGIVYVIYGQNGNFNNINLASLISEQGFRVLGAVAGDAIGCSVTSFDIDNDGIDDLVIGATGVSSSTGAVYVIYGKNTNFNDIDLLNLQPEQGFTIWGAAIADSTGCSLSSGDINGDGVKDLIIGARYADPNGRDAAGIVYIIYGKTGTFNNINLASLTSEQGLRLLGVEAGDYTGRAVNAADINDDGISDLIIGAPYANLDGKGAAGKVYII